MRADFISDVRRAEHIDEILGAMQTINIKSVVRKVVKHGLKYGLIKNLDDVVALADECPKSKSVIFETYDSWKS